jgi:hypothetical protein
MDLCYVGKQEYNCYIVGRDPGSVCDQGVSSGRCAFASAVGPGRGRFSLGAQRRWYYTVAYADDVAILINGKFPHTVSEILQTFLCTVQQWCERTKLSIKPHKTVVFPFTRKRNVNGLRKPTLFSKKSSYPVITSTLV